MGREIKRVALDFNWPINETWYGYLMPDDMCSDKCESCDGSGLNPETKKISDSWYTHLCSNGEKGWSDNITQDEVDALVEDDRLYDFTHVWITDTEHANPMTKKVLFETHPDKDEEYFDAWVENGAIEKLDETLDGEPLYVIMRGWWRRSDGYTPTADEVNEWSKTGMGHDGINHWVCTEARATRLGVYGKCHICNGEGSVWRDANHKAMYDAWEPQEPSAGEGWQLWETVSEGSPQSPAFATKEELSLWMQENGDGNSDPYTKEVADAFVEAGWAPSLIMTNGVVKKGAEIYTD